MTDSSIVLLSSLLMHRPILLETVLVPFVVFDALIESTIFNAAFTQTISVGSGRAWSLGASGSPAVHVFGSRPVEVQELDRAEESSRYFPAFHEGECVLEAVPRFCTRVPCYRSLRFIIGGYPR